jgi:dienelactone hydrolase
MSPANPFSRKWKLSVLLTLASLAMALNASHAQNCFVNTRIKKITADISWAIKSYLEYKPVDFATNPTKKYPLLIYFGGTGEMFQQPGGNDQDLCPVLQYSMPWRMNVGHFPNVVTDLTGQQFSYLVVMPFVTAWEQQYSADPGAVIDYMLQHYANRIDVSRIYLTGMSRGTDNLMGYATSNATAARRLAAIVPVANCFPAHLGPGQSTTYNQQVASLVNGNVHVWGISCAGDKVCTEEFMETWVNSVNAQRPGYAHFSYANLSCEGPDSSFHYAWNSAYDPDYRAAPGNRNVYEWMIQFSQNTLVPVRIKDWTARLERGKVMLEWTTSEELNTKEFIIERATANGQFETILTTPAAISSTRDRKYVLSDDQPLPGQSLYRLVMTDLDGKKEFFEIRRISMPGRWTENVIIANPVDHGQLSVFVQVEKAQRVSIRLFDLYGRLINQQDRQFGQGITTNNLDVSALPQGTYLVQVTGEDFRIAKKVLIN